jgi:hypothetical protein
MAQPRLGVKVVEYLSCSLPIIVNAYVGTAAALVNEHTVGIVLGDRDDAALRLRLLRLSSTSRVPDGRARELATYVLAAVLRLPVCGAVSRDNGDARIAIDA